VVPVIEAIPSTRVVHLLTPVETDALSAGDPSSLSRHECNNIDDVRVPYRRWSRLKPGDVVYVTIAIAAVGRDGSSGGSCDSGSYSLRRSLPVRAVVLATCGCCAPANPVLAAHAVAVAEHLPSSSAPLAAGDRVRLAVRLVVDTVRSDAVHVQSTGFAPLAAAIVPATVF